MTTLLNNVNLVQDGNITSCSLLLHNSLVQSILPQYSKCIKADTVYDLNGLFLSAGFVDIHVHGGGGHDFMDATKEAYHGASALHLKHGTTAMVPTTLASSKEELLKTFAIFKSCNGGFQDGAKLLGLHIEGPYISKSQCGAQDLRFIRNPEPSEYEELLAACPQILRWTVAPELDGANNFGDVLCAHGILPCIGHSEATDAQVVQAMLHGYTHITHLYSATSTIVRIKGFRHAGIVESAYLYNKLTSEIIADGCHLPASLLRMAYQFIGPKRLALVTDSMRGAGSESGESVLGSLKNGQRVILEDGVAKLPDLSAFAGSICTTDKLVRNMITLAGASLPDAICMMTQTPAEILGIAQQYGRVAVGRIADLVVFDKDINIHMVFKDGILRFSDNEIGEKKI
ncbi:MAG: N-acetylglucosamine-6-phosphate deacetylase [Oscillospiraceae bacterium]